jgi:putative heme-binding domain-containing protein
MKGDVMQGRQLFRKICSTCHKLEDHGEQIGPDLRTMRNRGSQAILLNVLDPNREVNPRYLNYIALTVEGRSQTGMIMAETASSITMQEAKKKPVSLLRTEIEELRSSGLSLMPEGLEKEISPQAMADLLAYLNSLK